MNLIRMLGDCSRSHDSHITCTHIEQAVHNKGVITTGGHFKLTNRMKYFNTI